MYSSSTTSHSNRSGGEHSAAKAKGCLILLVMLLCCPSLVAQIDLSTIRGTATDPTAAVVPGVTITLLNTETNVSRSTETNASGDYEIPYLGPGIYRLTAEAPGFQNFIAEDIVITARETRRIQVRLQLGTVGTEVTVTAGAAVIRTEGAEVADGFNTDHFVDNPLSQSFFPQAVMTTLPNIQTDEGGWGLRFAGQSGNQIAESLDGITNNGAVNLVQNMNDFEELTVTPAGNSAEFPRVANFGMTGKSGGNDFHGRVYYDLNNSALNARNFFEAQKTPYKEHRGGAGFSGPIIKNKTFFYVAYSMVRIPSGSFRLADVPPTAFRDGDLSSSAKQVIDPSTGAAFPNNQIPRERFSSVSTKTLDSYMPLPNRGGPDQRAGNFEFVHPYPGDIKSWDSTTDRVDHYFNDKNTIFFRFINRLTPYILARNLPDFVWTRERDHFSIVLSDTHIFSPTLVNTARWGWISDFFEDGTTVSGVTPINGADAVAQIGLQGVNPRGLSAMGFPTMNITGFTSMSAQPGGINLDRDDFTYSNSTTWSTGSHVLKWGGELRTFDDFKATIKAGTYGQFDFDGSVTGEPFADFLLGIPIRSRRLDPLTDRTQKSYELGFFVTDTYKMTRKFTVDWGIRWDYFNATTINDGLQFNWDPSTGNVVVPRAALSSISPLYPSTINVVEGEVAPTPKRDNFRPRIGLAYRLRDDLVVRGGYGVFTEALGNLTRINITGPFEIEEDFTNQIVNGLPAFSFPNPFPSSGARIPSQSVSGYPLEANNGVIHQFNLSIEKEFSGVGFRTSYIGSRSRGLNYNLSLNKPQPSLIPFAPGRRPWPQFVDTSFIQEDGRQNYDSLQFQVDRKMGDFILNAHYTLSSSMSDFLNLENPYNHAFWNRDRFNSRHRAVINATYYVPYGRGKRWGNTAPAVVDGVLGGWQVGWISYLQSGQYFSPSKAGADTSNTNTRGGLPDRIADGNLDSGSREVTRWFDASAFALPPAGRFGNSGVNILEGPGWNLHHLALIKNFRVTEKWKVLLQGNISNLPNHPHFAPPASNISVPGTVARITATKGALGGGREKSASRVVQIRLRIEF